MDRNYNGNKEYSDSLLHKQMTISSTGKDMLVQFLTDNEHTDLGFRASFRYIVIDKNQNCAIWLYWLNKTSQLLKSPEYPTIECSWIITAPIDNAIIIQFETFGVKCI